MMLTVDPEDGVLKGTNFEEHALENHFALGAEMQKALEQGIARP